jgi:hypothetical protein
MTSFLSKEVLEGLELARKLALKKNARMRVRVDDQVFPVLDFTETGFALDIDNAPKLRGLIDLYEGPRHLYQCLIMASEEDGGLMRYEFKRATSVSETAPLDFVRAKDAPVALIAG